MSIKLLKEELKENKIRISNLTDEIVEEIFFSLIAKKHERKIKSYGAIFLDEIPLNSKLIELKKDEINLARDLADGVQSFVCYKENELKGVIIFPTKLDNENLLINLSSEVKGLIVTRDLSGIIKIFQEERIIIQENRVWQIKPSIYSILSNIRKCVPQVNPKSFHKTLVSILEFAYYQLSPNNTGAILIWSLADVTTEDLKTMPINKDLSHLNLNVNEQESLQLISTLLKQIDGATIIDPTGKVLGTEVHLIYSERSKSLINQIKGTRHTTSHRYSFDNEKVIAVVVSEDGPITIYSDGVDIARLDIFSASDMEMRINIDYPDAATVSGNSKVECSTCHKTFIVEELVIYGHKDTETERCSICNSKLYQARCFRLDSHIVKVLPHERKK